MKITCSIFTITAVSGLRMRSRCSGERRWSERGDIGDARDIWKLVPANELMQPVTSTVIVLDSANGNVYQNILEHVGQGVTKARRAKM